MNARLARTVALGAALALSIAACSGNSDESSGGGGRVPSELPECPLAALESATKPVALKMWHSFPEENLKALQALADSFNASQSDIVVSLEQQAKYDDTLTKLTSGLSTGDLPGLAVLEDTATQTMIDSRAVLPAQSCVDATDYPIDDVIARVREYYTVDGVLWPMPFNTSNPIMYFNKDMFTKAGLDPEKPPTTFAELKSAAEKLKAVVPTPIALKLDPWYLEQWLAVDNEPYVNNDNGRSKPATEVEFNNDSGIEIFSFLDELHDAGLLQTYPRDGFDNLLAMGQLQAAISFDTSAAIGTAVTAIEGGLFPDFQLSYLGATPLPKPDADSDGGTFIAGGALYIVSGSNSNPVPPEVQAAAWTFATYLNEPVNQAQFAGRSGYIPITEAAANEPITQQTWSTYPFYKVAYDQVTTGPESTATAGPVMGNFAEQRKVIIAQMQSMFSQGKEPATAVADAATESNQILRDYNASFGR